MTAKPILLVDDEVLVLNSLSRSLSEMDFEDIKTARSGQEAMEVLKNTPELAVIVSDYHMPGMNGIELLSTVRDGYPDVTRILLTGAADMQMAIESVNKGNVFRFLIKPCSTEHFTAAIIDALRQNELITSERELLSKTLMGGIKVMVDILAVLSPGIFAQAGRLRNLAREFAVTLGVPDQSWEMELAALLSQIGAVTIPRSLLEKWQKDELLEERETRVIRSIPRMGKQLVKNIPRMEMVADAIGYQACTYVGQLTVDSPTGEAIPYLARTLKILVDYERLVEKAYSPSVAFHTMMIHESEYDPTLMAVFGRKVLHMDEQSTYHLSGALKGETEVHVDGIRLGMVLSRDVVDQNGILIVSSGTTITEVLMYKLINYFHAQALGESIYIERTY